MMHRLARIGAAALCSAVLATAVYWSHEPVRVRIVTQPQVAEAAVMPVVLTVDERLVGGPTVFILRVRAAAEPLDLTVSLGREVLAETRVAADSEQRIDLAVAVLDEEATTLTLAAPRAGWVLEYLEIANAHRDTGPPLEIVVVPDVAGGEAGSPWAAVLLLAALVVMVPRVDWAPRPLRVVHAAAAGLAAVVFAASLLAPLVSPYRVLLPPSVFMAGLAVLYARPLALGLTQLLRTVLHGRLTVRDAGPLPSRGEVLAAAAGFIALVAIFLHPQVRDLRGVPDLGDPLFSIWRIGWVAHQLWADPRHLFDANIFYPEAATLTYSDSMLLPALTAMPLLRVGVHPVVVYNLLLLSGFALSGLATYVLARGLGFGRPAAWVSGVIFVVHPYRLDHFPHLELQMAQWMPLALLGTHRVMATGSWRWAALTAVLIAAQWYSSMYYALFLSLYLAVFGVVLAPAGRDWRRLALAGCAVIAGAMLALPLVWAYSASQAARGERPVEEVALYSATPVDYLQPTWRSAHYGARRDGGKPERDLFPGVAPVALAAAGALPPWTPTRLAILAGGLAAFDGSLGLNGLLYPWMYDWLPPLKSVRVPARFAILVALTLALLGGAAVERWMAGRRRITGAVLAAAASIVLVVEAWPSIRLVPVWGAPPPIYGSLGPDSGAVLMEYPMSPDPSFFTENLPFMYFSVWHLTPMVNGYSGFMSAHYDKLAPATAGFPEGDTVERLREAGVTHVSVICAIDGPIRELGQRSYEPERCERTIALMDAHPRLRAVVRSVWEDAPAILYEIVPAR
jgi:hypothetical protein